MYSRSIAWLMSCVLPAFLILVGPDMALAQEQKTEPDTPVVAEDYLDPLRALEANESAFVDKLWEMGDAELARLQELQSMLAAPGLDSAKAGEIVKELALRTKQADALSLYALKKYDHNARVHNFRGNVCYDVLHRQIDGLQEWHTAVSLDSHYADPYNNLGMHYFHAGEYPLGFHNMDRALELDSKNADFCFNMVQNYLIYRNQTAKFRHWPLKKVYKEAMKLSKKATHLAPSDFQILQDYAVNFLAAEDFGVAADWREAVKAWQAAREHAPTDDSRFYTWLNEGRVWRTMEKKDEALRCFREALTIRPDSEVTQRNIAKLEEAG